MSQEFVLQWLIDNPQYLATQLFVGGDSYAGIIVPLVTKYIIDGNLCLTTSTPLFCYLEQN